MVLLDRTEERAAIDDAIEAVSSGHSRVLVFAGDAGMGKTSLLKYAVDSASQFRIAWIAGVEAESDLGFAALHRLIRLLTPRLDHLPDPQRRALEAAFGESDGVPADRFLLGLACLNLLADLGAEHGLLCVLDDAQWIDRESLEALSFVARRVDADPVALLFGVRELSQAGGTLDGLPIMYVGGLPDDAAFELLSASLDTQVAPDTGRSIIGETGGCPLALIELSSGLTKHQLRGGVPLGEVLPIGRQLENHFLGVARSLDVTAQIFLLVAAAETSGDVALVRRAAFKLGADADAEDASIASGLLSMRPTVSFRHPLIRVAVYSGAPSAQRSRVHKTLADLIDRTDPDRRVQHLASAARGPDATLAVELERAAERSARRGGYAAETHFLLQAAELSPGSADQGRRFLAAATAARNAGLPVRSEALLEQARKFLTEPRLEAEAIRLDGTLRVHLGDAGAAPALLYKAAIALQPLDPELATNAFINALETCSIAQHFTKGIVPETIARRALSSRAASDTSTRLDDILLDGTAFLFVSEFGNAMRALHRAAPMLRTGPVTRNQISDWFNLVLVLTNELHDDETYNVWVHRVEAQARVDGALFALQYVLVGRAKLETRAGHFAAAEMTYDEVVEVSRLIGGFPEFWGMNKVDLYAWRGLETETRTIARAFREGGSAVGSAAATNTADLALGTLELGMGRYRDALRVVRGLVDTNMPGWTCLALPIAIEAATRSGQRDLAEKYIEQLRVRTDASGTNWALGQLSRCRALLGNGEAEELHHEAIRLLSETSVVAELAQAHLGYGEWLRREGRQVDARGELRLAHEMFATMGANAFALRARNELSAAGDQVQRRRSNFRTSLTPQEGHAARLAAAGETNAEIGARMFISTNTVDYHLRKVYRKLGIVSRRELSQALSVLEDR
jgi:DNA-binding CsgD family transcriptional regulator